MMTEMSEDGREEIWKDAQQKAVSNLAYHDTQLYQVFPLSAINAGIPTIRMPFDIFPHSRLILSLDLLSC